MRMKIPASGKKNGISRCLVDQDGRAGVEAGRRGILYLLNSRGSAWKLKQAMPGMSEVLQPSGSREEPALGAVGLGGELMEEGRYVGRVIRQRGQ